MKVSLDKEITVYVVASEYEDALMNGNLADYYLTLDDLYECVGYVPHVELLMPEWLELDSNCIDITKLNLN